ncbi:four helix bundle protein [Candidatus Roizmanbacteria bacterium CG_4_9_14_0_2_um_filter_39_13]|uniref:Four helix bundle protein n=1 Tax=Candidatus Roizmanbacteria bacterium CG_4_9_14_0_2_um_filter_39_13 TaxID=1974839 RepID=A0A2M8F4C8_9BACT|nr:MAG: four helix bundle protein [Candidatus Roizmanbacteria bacterium CG_4_10_14_0_2_um_filter_39_12]PJC34164.1 MAG: four helix bundle protein [Candidatus Roizmanbacteria bacterium CG_4_9_14_0_2_um_filter_39_13]
MNQVINNPYKEKLKRLMDDYVQLAYEISKNFPKSEIYGVTSQYRRSTMSIILNYIEGFARRKKPVQLNFFEISYGSLSESKYLLSFVYKQNWIDEVVFLKGKKYTNEIGAMLWREITNLDSKINS